MSYIQTTNRTIERSPNVPGFSNADNVRRVGEGEKFEFIKSVKRLLALKKGTFSRVEERGGVEDGGGFERGVDEGGEEDKEVGKD